MGYCTISLWMLRASVEDMKRAGRSEKEIRELLPFIASTIYKESPDEIEGVIQRLEKDHAESDPVRP